MKISGGLSGLFSFAKYLNKKGITYSLHQYGDDSLTVFFTVVGARIEVTFYEYYANYSVFRGSEDVFENGDDLEAIIDKHWSD